MGPGRSSRAPNGLNNALMRCEGVRTKGGRLIELGGFIVIFMRYEPERRQLWTLQENAR
jgi:hypothetical protein